MLEDVSGERKSAWCFQSTDALLDARMMLCASMCLCHLFWNRFGQQVLKDDSNFKGSEEVVPTVQTCVSVLDGIQVKRMRVIWMHLGTACAQEFPGHVVNFLLNRFKDHSLTEMGKKVTLMK